MHKELASLSVFFDPLAVAAALSDALNVQAAEAAEGERLPAELASRTATVNDHDLLRRLLPQELYSFWREAGYAGMYSMTFLLRHAVTFLAVAAHEKFCTSALYDLRSSLVSFLNEHFDAPNEALAQDCIDVLSPLPLSLYPVLGFSSLGAHLSYRAAGFCRAFDYYDIVSCAASADGLFCPAHNSEAWWCSGGQTPSTQAEMFRFYAVKDNIDHYDEELLQELVGRFWTHFRRTSRHASAQQGAIGEAIVFFDYGNLAECLDHGQIELRRRYTKRARLLHPDTGGEHGLFVQLQTYYEVLRMHMNYEKAGCFV
jgi:hypothetical protein